jgi:NTP pyrophosphatase (non-canonical NTP hydrolase)
MNQQPKRTSAARPLSAGELEDSVAAPAASKSTVPPSTAPPPLALQSFQQLIRRMYFEKDVARGIDGTFMWLMEEVGELAAALRSGTHAERLGEFADVLAWLATIANVAGVDLADAVALKYGTGCPGCGQLICQCADAEKP